MRFDRVAETNSNSEFDGNNGPWFGLSLHHRRLLDSLQDGWLRPPGEKTGLILGNSAFVSEQFETGKHTIIVQLKFVADKLPSLDVFVLRGERWFPCKLMEIESSDHTVYWPGSLPTFAVSALYVKNDQERIRLSTLARQFSNLSLPIDVTVNTTESISPQHQHEPPESNRRIDIPHDEDAIRGAMSMAVWAVPKTDPWLELLVTSLSFDNKKTTKSAANVEANWWRVPPWSDWPNNVKIKDLQDGFWRSAIEVFSEHSGQSGVSPYVLAEKIKSKADSAYCTDYSSTDTSAWLDNTNQILRADSVFSVINWQHNPVGKAIQLVLTRPEPDNFKTWRRDIHDLPPIVWWSAAVLCGLKHGYKRLNLCFRGEVPLQEALTIHALQSCNLSLKNMKWPSLTGDPNWRRNGDGFELLWGNAVIAQKQGNARSRWYVADFKKDLIRSSAVTLAKELNWTCLRQTLQLKSGQIAYSGTGEIEIRDHRLAIHGEITLEMPSNVDIRSELDVESFRHLVAVSAGQLPDPPQVVAQVSISKNHIITGLNYVPDFVSETEEAELVAKIDSNVWLTDIKRRVQHYGWRYDYANRQVNPAMRIDDLPDWAIEIAHRLVDQKLVKQMPDQLIVNEYKGSQGIGRHIDSEPYFADNIAMISLLESWEMVFRQKSNSKIKHNIMLDNRSVAIMSGPARYLWTHEIPSRKYEPGPELLDGKRSRKLRKRRLSLTFRKVLHEILR